MDIPRYLERIRYARPLERDAETLRGLQRAHMLRVPFENLDIGRKCPIRLTAQALWEKIVVQKRGGFCYELNGLFASFLKQIGYQVTYLNARVYNRQGQLGQDFDHLALLVTIPEQATRWLVDVGFGDSFLEPLDLDDAGDQIEGLRAYRLEQTGSGYTLWQRDYDGTWSRQYFFDLQAHDFPAEYEGGCLYHQTSPQSSFTQRSVITRATPEGRVTLLDDSIIFTQDGKRQERPLRDKTEYEELLNEYFDITFVEAAP